LEGKKVTRKFLDGYANRDTQVKGPVAFFEEESGGRKGEKLSSYSIILESQNIGKDAGKRFKNANVLLW